MYHKDKDQQLSDIQEAHPRRKVLLEATKVDCLVLPTAVRMVGSLAAMKAAKMVRNWAQTKAVKKVGSLAAMKVARMVGSWTKVARIVGS